MKNPRYANEEGGILIEQENGVDIYTDSGELYQEALAGKFGDIQPHIAPPPKPAPIPQSVSRYQLLAALSDEGLLAEAKTAASNAPARVKLAFENATSLPRNSQIITAIGNALDLTDEQLDDLFRLAITIEA